MFTFHCSAKRNMIQIKPVVGCTVPKKENMLKATERDIGSTWQPDLLRRNQCNKASFAATCDERTTCCCYLVLIVMIHILGCSHYLQNHTTIQGMNGSHLGLQGGLPGNLLCFGRLPLWLCGIIASEQWPQWTLGLTLEVQLKPTIVHQLFISRI